MKDNKYKIEKKETISASGEDYTTSKQVEPRKIAGGCNKCSCNSPGCDDCRIVPGLDGMQKKIK